jgi:hypothetical protein
LICAMIRTRHVEFIFLTNSIGLKVWRNNLAFSFVRPIVACLQACYVCCTARVGYAFGQLYSEKNILIR